MLDLARAVAKLGCANVLLKGGHAAGDGEIIDLLYETASGRHTTYRHRCVGMHPDGLSGG